jgi:sn-glycerol 3-phosphate transport system permease protein
MKRRAVEIYAWLLLLPALALLALFTHWPALETLFDSLHTTPRGRRGAAFVGIDNYRQMLEDPVFRQSIANNLWYALGTIPTSIALALLMAIWVNDRIAGRTALRMAYFTPTVLPMIAVANICATPPAPCNQ